MKTNSESKSTDSQYPRPINTPLDRAYLRPLQQPLYDAEILNPYKTRLRFFHTPIGRMAYDSDEEKTNHDTNMTSGDRLDYPREFSILGFRANADSLTDKDDRNEVLGSGALFEFSIAGKVYFSAPLQTVFARNVDESSISEILSQCFSVNYDDPKQGDVKTTSGSEVDAALKTLERVAHRQKFHRFNIGRAALKIESGPNGEDFGVQISWKTPPQISKPVKIIVEIIGLYWMPL